MVKDGAEREGDGGCLVEERFLSELQSDLSTPTAQACISPRTLSDLYGFTLWTSKKRAEAFGTLQQGLLYCVCVYV